MSTRCERWRLRNAARKEADALRDEQYANEVAASQLERVSRDIRVTVEYSLPPPVHAFCSPPGSPAIQTPGTGISRTSVDIALSPIVNRPTSVTTGCGGTPELSKRQKVWRKKSTNVPPRALDVTLADGGDLTSDSVVRCLQDELDAEDARKVAAVQRAEEAAKKKEQKEEQKQERARIAEEKQRERERERERTTQEKEERKKDRERAAKEKEDRKQDRERAAKEKKEQKDREERAEKERKEREEREEKERKEREEREEKERKERAERERAMQPAWKTRARRSAAPDLPPPMPAPCHSRKRAVREEPTDAAVMSRGLRKRQKPARFLDGGAEALCVCGIDLWLCTKCGVSPHASQASSSASQQV